MLLLHYMHWNQSWSHLYYLLKLLELHKHHRDCSWSTPGDTTDKQGTAFLYWALCCAPISKLVLQAEVAHAVFNVLKWTPINNFTLNFCWKLYQHCNKARRFLCHCWYFTERKCILVNLSHYTNSLHFQHLSLFVIRTTRSITLKRD